MVTTFGAVAPDGPQFDKFAFLRSPFWGGEGDGEGVGSGWRQLLLQLLRGGASIRQIRIFEFPLLGGRG